MRIRHAVGLSVLGSPNGLSIYEAETSSELEPEVLSAPGFLEAVELCEEWTPRDEVAARLAESTSSSREEAEATIDVLLENGVLVGDDVPRQVTVARAEREWERVGWGDALVYHWHVDNLKRLDYRSDADFATDVRRMKEFVQREEPPPNYKNYPDRPRLALDREAKGPAATRSLREALVDEVGGTHGNTTMEIDELSWFLRVAFGENHVRYLPVTGAHVGKTSPSGGGRHPTEVYPLVLDVNGVAPGLYHYSVEGHALELLAEGNHQELARQHLFRRPGRPGFAPRVVFVFATVFERSMFRYRESFSYKVMQHDLGHVMQTTGLLASAAGRSSYRAYSLADAQVEKALGLDGLSEAAMAFAAVG